MRKSNLNRLHLALAAVQAFGAALASLSLLGVPPASFSKAIFWMIITVAGAGFAVILYSLRRGEQLDISASSRSQTQTIERAPGAAGGHVVVHRMVALTLWSVLAACVVVYLTSHLMSLFMIGLAPLWIGAGSFMANRIAREDRVSPVLLSSLFCGAFGAWLGSAGNHGMVFGFLWGSLTGALTGDYLATSSPYVGIWPCLVGSVIFTTSIGFLLSPWDDFMVGAIGNFIRAGFTSLAMEAMVLCMIYALGTLVPRNVLRSVMGRT